MKINSVRMRAPPWPRKGTVRATGPRGHTMVVYNFKKIETVPTASVRVAGTGTLIGLQR